MRLKSVSPLTLFAVAALVTATSSDAKGAMFQAGVDPTTAFTEIFIDDVTPTGGFDTGTATSFNPARDLDIPVGQGPVDIAFEGIGLNPRGGTATTEETVTITITYLGADNVFGGSDDVLLGSESASLQYLGAVDEYTAIFDNPITGEIDGLNDRFRIGIESTGNLRFKGFNAAGAPSGQNGLKISLGGTATVIPEPSAAALLGLASLGLVRRRR
ncbi:MAG: PEP-CTERM sorting domain-containing protein [Planctomycetota bacterium]